MSNVTVWYGDAQTSRKILEIAHWLSLHGTDSGRVAIVTDEVPSCSFDLVLGWALRLCSVTGILTGETTESWLRNITVYPEGHPVSGQGPFSRIVNATGNRDSKTYAELLNKKRDCYARMLELYPSYPKAKESKDFSPLIPDEVLEELQTRKLRDPFTVMVLQMCQVFLSNYKPYQQDLIHLELAVAFIELLNKRKVENSNG